MVTSAVDIPGALLEVLRDIGLDSPDLSMPLHAKLVETLKRLGPGASQGTRLVALRFDFNWELEEAGRVFAKAKTDYEHHIDRAAVKARLEGEKSGEMAVRIANSSDDAYRLLLEYRLAEQRERAVRNFLQTIQSALDNFRTMSADARAADLHHAKVGV